MGQSTAIGNRNPSHSRGRVGRADGPSGRRGGEASRPGKRGPGKRAGEGGDGLREEHTEPLLRNQSWALQRQESPPVSASLNRSHYSNRCQRTASLGFITKVCNTENKPKRPK